MTMNQGPYLGQSYTCGGIKPINGTSTFPFLIITYPLPIQIYTNNNKSTLIDGIINYITDVSWDDDFRFSLVDLTDDEKNKKTNEVKYKLLI
jgi:hypothetical protein